MCFAFNNVMTNLCCFLKFKKYFLKVLLKETFVDAWHAVLTLCTENVIMFLHFKHFGEFQTEKYILFHMKAFLNFVEKQLILIK